MRRLWTALLPVAACLAAATTHAAPTPLELGWTVRLVASSLGHFMNGIAYDPVSTDLFVTADHGRKLYRITQAGAATQIHGDASFTLDALAFDPVTRRLYVGGNGQLTLRVLDEFGNGLGDVSVPGRYTGIALAPNGSIHLNLTDLGEIRRYDAGSGTFPLHAGGLCASLDGLTFDAAGDAYVAEPLCDREQRVPPGGPPAPIGNVAAPRGISFGDASAFVTAFDSAVWRVDAGGGGVTAFANGLDAALGVHHAANGRVYVADFNTSELWEFRPAVTPVETRSWGGLKLIYR